MGGKPRYSKLGEDGQLCVQGQAHPSCCGLKKERLCLNTSWVRRNCCCPPILSILGYCREIQQGWDFLVITSFPYTAPVKVCSSGGR